MTVRYLVKDVEAAIKFYTSQLDFKLQEQMGSAFARISRDGWELRLSGPQSSAARKMPDGSSPKPGGWNRIVIETENISETVIRLKTAGTTFRGKIIAGPGGKQVLIEDPSGNPIELFEAVR